MLHLPEGDPSSKTPISESSLASFSCLLHSLTNAQGEGLATLEFLQRHQRHLKEGAVVKFAWRPVDGVPHTQSNTIPFHPLPPKQYFLEPCTELRALRHLQKPFDSGRNSFLPTGILPPSVAAFWRVVIMQGPRAGIHHLPGTKTPPQIQGPPHSLKKSSHSDTHPLSAAKAEKIFLKIVWKPCQAHEVAVAPQHK